MTNSYNLITFLLAYFCWDPEITRSSGSSMVRHLASHTPAISRTDLCFPLTSFPTKCGFFKALFALLSSCLRYHPHDIRFNYFLSTSVLSNPPASSFSISLSESSSDAISAAGSFSVAREIKLSEIYVTTVA